MRGKQGGSSSCSSSQLHQRRERVWTFRRHHNMRERHCLPRKLRAYARQRRRPSRRPQAVSAADEGGRRTLLLLLQGIRCRRGESASRCCCCCCRLRRGARSALTSILLSTSRAPLPTTTPPEINTSCSTSRCPSRRATPPLSVRSLVERQLARNEGEQLRDVCRVLC